MPSVSQKPLIWLLEEATPEVAQLMHQLERSLAGQATVQRVSYTDALRTLPGEALRQGLVAIVVFSPTYLLNLATLLKNDVPARPRLCFLPPTYETLAALKTTQRWPSPVSAAVRHLGEAALLLATGFKPEYVVRLQAEITVSALPERSGPTGQPLRVGFGWYNMAPAQRDMMAMQIARWRQSAPDRCVWTMFCLPGDEPPPDALEGVERVVLSDGVIRRTGGKPDDPALDALPFGFDVWLRDPWWPDVRPSPGRAPVTIFLPPGGTAGDGWEERLQALMDCGEPAEWRDDTLWSFGLQPLWRHLLRGTDGTPATSPDERALPGLSSPDLAALESERARWHAWLAASREAWPAAGPEPSELARFYRIYDYRVEVSWCLDLWRALAVARNGERHGLIGALNALSLHHTSACWLFKRLLAATATARASRRPHRFTRWFWWRFVLGHVGLVGRWLGALWRCGRDPDVDPLGASREVSAGLLVATGIEVVRRNEPAPVPGVPTIYLMSHRHGDLDPFLLLGALPGHVAVVVGPRAQRWPLIGRLTHSSAFVVTSRERGVVDADAIAAVRARRALALYPEVAEPSYLGEGTPLRAGLMWIVQALERSQVIPVVLDDAFALGPAGGRVDLWFGPPIHCTPDTGDELLLRVRMFYQRHLARMNDLDGPGPLGDPPSLEAMVSAVDPAPVERQKTGP